MEKTQVLLRMPLNLKNNISEIAKLQGLTTNALIITILNDYIKSAQQGKEQSVWMIKK